VQQNEDAGFYTAQLQTSSIRLKKDFALNCGK